MHDWLRKALARVKRPFELLEAIIAWWHVLPICITLSVPFLLTDSDTLRGSIVIFGIVGAVFGFYLTANAWADKAKVRRLQQRNVYLACVLLPLVLLFSVLVVLNAPMAIKYPSIRPTREFLLSAGPLVNFLCGLCSGAVQYLLAGAVTLGSRKL